MGEHRCLDPRHQATGLVPFLSPSSSPMPFCPQLSSALERVHLAEESNTSLRQSFEGLKTKMVILKTKLATAKADALAFNII
jgi:hypothetical protein